MSPFMVVVCCALAAVIATEGTLHYLRDQSGAAPAPRRAAPSAAAAVPARVPDGQWLATALARPLFSPDRKPPPGVTVADPGLPRLSGIIMIAHEPVGIFKSDESGKSTIVRSGDSIAGWRVAEIERDAIYLEKPGERVIVMPKFASPSAAPQPPVQARR
jgi:hypothetical protein